VVCAFAIAWCWIVLQKRLQERWTWLFLTLFALTALLAFADTLLHSAAIPGLYMGEAMRAEPKWALEFQANRLVIGAVPPGPRFTRANGIAIAAQLYIAFFASAFFWILAKARLLPRSAPLAFLAIWLLSGVRFLF
ncbi:MAG TPA: hypothetical protein VKB93_14750, partial [Thermoanaerobaculia bacterium]|nr:hypothetical protein [Thermoanaerobaculia bacterium]